ncbi:hypothetical protein AB835_07635 [Candidatus Endobugula sertula]|uniref:HTH merR-type domain-containing protein n=1 Tax=Candidatus Endobugula sertula TaxID=62101 RepID=A0A1D2QQ12_9GAMM|nr:hypothetical protein AB835_07635 [Candidatus Endobugula sertula]
MTDKITLKTKDICDALDIGRHQLRAWTDGLEPYCLRETRERSACRYDSADLLYFAVIKHIVDNCGLTLPFVAKFSQQLYLCIREPNSLTSSPFLFITNKGNSCKRLNLDKVTQEGTIIDLQPANILVYQFLGLSSQQGQLPLGLREVN